MSIKKLIIEECANWVRNGPSETQNYCWAKEQSNEGVCVLFGKPPKPCKYFEDCVLPLAEDLTEEYSKIIKEAKNGESERLESVDLGNGVGQGTGPSQVIHVPPAPGWMPVGKHIKKTLLPCHPIHGVGFKKEAAEGGREVGNR
jgi:hypothetical protein